MNLLCSQSLLAVLNTGRLLSQGLEVLLVIVIAFALLVLATSFVRYQLLFYDLKSGSPEDIDPDDRFKMDILDRIGSVTRSPEPFAVLLFRIRDFGALVDPEQPEQQALLFEETEKKLKANLRHDDIPCLYDNRLFGLALKIDRPRALEFAQRVIKSVALTPYPAPDGRMLSVTLEAGIATYPLNGMGVSELVTQAEAALDLTTKTDSYSAARAPLPMGIEEPVDEPESEGQASGSMVDPVTGVLRYERLNSALQKFVAQYRKQGKPVAIMVVDIDRLDRYNDHYGPASGDAILKAVGRLLEHSLRETDIIGRYKKDEFVAALGGSSRQAMAAATRVAGEIKQVVVDYEGAKLKVTASIGVASHPEHGSVPSELMQGALLAVEAAKENGKGQCMKFDPKTMTPATNDGPTESF